MHTNAQVRLKTASRQVGRQASFQHDSSWLLAGCSGAVRLVPDQRLLRQSCMHSRRRALQCDMDHGTSAARCGKARLGRIQVGALVAAGEGGFVGGGQWYWCRVWVVYMDLHVHAP